MAGVRGVPVDEEEMEKVEGEGGAEVQGEVKGLVVTAEAVHMRQRSTGGGSM
jgi:hypothetical protein